MKKQIKSEQIFAWLDFSSVYKGETFQVQAIFLQIKVHKCTKLRINYYLHLEKSHLVYKSSIVDVFQVYDK